MAGQGSARVTLNEIDLSQVRDPEQLPQGVPAAVVGPAKRGPAFVPKTFATIQQFNETFGSLQEVSKESNANRFGPLALNEWMRNAQAGTFLRVLGVGDGNAKASNGRVTDAGFVVGDNTTYDSNNELQRNPHASGLTASNEVTALKTARTHFLGCFMKDQGDSTFLQDAGIQGDNAQAALTIKFDAVPADNSHITLISGAASITYGFRSDGGQIDDQGDGVTVVANLVVDTTVNSTDVQVATALAALIQGVNGHNAGTNDSAISIDNSVNGQLVLTQVEAGIDGNTLVSSRLFAAEADDITITGSSTIRNSLASETIQFREGVNGTKASAEIVINTATNAEDLHEDDAITLNSLTSVGGSVQTIFTFKDGAGEAFNGEVFIETDASNVQVLLGGGDSLSQQKETLANLNTAINSATTSNVYLDGMRSTLSADGLTLTVFQGYAGVEGNGLNVVSTLNSAAFEIQGTAGTGVANTDAFTGGVAADKASISLAFSDQPNIGDSITLPQFSTADASEEFRFVADANGSVNGDLDADVIKVELGDVLAITLENLKNAIHLNSTANVDDDDVTVTVDGNTVKIEAVAAGLDENLDATLKLASSVLASNPQGDSFTCNFGTKTTNFAGGDSSITTPVVRGVLMSPQGVIPAMAIANEVSYSSIPSGNADISKSVVSNDNVTLLNFGNTVASDLIGYQLGTVTTTDEQTFKIVLNGFESDVDSAVLTCSFNPESPNYFAKVMNTDPEKIEERGHYLHAHWDIDPAVARADSTGLLDDDDVAATTDMLGFCIHSEGDRAEENLVGGAITANTPDFESFDSRFRTARSPWIMSQKNGGTSRKLFRLHSLDDGEAGNDRFRIMISNIRAGETDSDFGFFDLTLEAFDSDPISGEKLIQWNSLSLNPDDKNYIARVIGDKHMYYDFDRSQSKQRLVEEGDYEVRNRFVRVEVSVDVETADGASWARAALPCGFKEYKTLNLAPSGRTGLFVELGTDGSGTNRLLPAGSFDSLKVLPLPFVKHITRKSGLTTETSEALAWGVKFAKKQKAAAHQEIGEIRFNPSIVSWTKFFPDMGSSPFAVDSTEEFSLEHIAWDGSDWATSEYIRSGEVADLGGKQFVQLAEAAKSGRSVRFLKFRCMMQGGFDGLNIFNKEKAAMSSVAAFREANEEVADSNIFTGPTIVAYKRAIDVLADKSATEFQLLAIPGIREPLITDYAITACESRFDAMFVMDIQECDRLTAVILDDTKPSVNKTISNFSDRRLDTSFAAAYFPDVIMRRPSNGSPLQVPPSVGMLGVMSLNDTLADPWFAPAGLRRGRLVAQNVKVQMNRDTLNDLYDADINPIYEPAGRAGEVYAFGQKTLLQNQSALDRINVRRLLINIRRQVKAVANTLLFEPNRASTLAKFNALVEPIMSNVQARQGVDRYKVQIDTTTTTENDVLNNTIRGKIYLQPTKSVEFISLDFVVTNSID